MIYVSGIASITFKKDGWVCIKNLEIALLFVKGKQVKLCEMSSVGCGSYLIR